MSLIEKLEQNSLVENTKGGLYYSTSYDANLDVFAGLSRYNGENEIVAKFNAAINENEVLALANLLYTLDIRGGKGERRLFKIMFNSLCNSNKELALKVLPFISKLGRYDYVLVGLNTKIENEVVDLIKKQLDSDSKSERPSLLCKWLPSHRTHGKNNPVARYLMDKLGMTEKEYRKTLAKLREKVAIVERNLTFRDYDSVKFEAVPTKAMLKYRQSFMRNVGDKYEDYLQDVKKCEKKINTEGLFCYEIVKKILTGYPTEKEKELYDLMWNNQKDVVENNSKNILVMADTSGSMMSFGCLPLANSIGLAIYTAERNKGYFHNHFLTFSSRPKLVKVEGDTIIDKVYNVNPIVENTNIDSAFELLLESAVDENIPKEEMPEEIIIISDMEFDRGVYSKNGTNFNGWKEAFKESGYKLPKIVFWNVAGKTRGLPATKHDQDCLMISGFSTNLVGSILSGEEFNPYDSMIEILTPYINMLEASV